MTKAALVMCGSGIVVAGALVFLQLHESAALRAEFALLRAEVRSISAGGADRPRVEAPAPTTASAPIPNAFDQAELKKLREDIAALRKSTQEISQFTQMAQAAAALKTLGSTESSIATKLTPAEALRNLGRATPESAAETILWAAVGGDVDALSRAFVFTPTARELEGARGLRSLEGLELDRKSHV